MITGHPMPPHQVNHRDLPKLNMNESDWAMKKILYFNGSLDNRQGYYAAAEEGCEDWRKIDFHTIELGEITLDSTKAHERLAKRAPKLKTVVTKRGTTLGTEAAHLRQDRLDDYCTKHPNKAYTLDEAGAW